MQSQEEIYMSFGKRASLSASLQLIICCRSAAALKSCCLSGQQELVKILLPPLPPGVFERPSHVSCSCMIRMLPASLCTMQLHGSDAGCSSAFLSLNL